MYTRINMNTNYRVRMLVELKELEDKITRLNEFLDNPPRNFNKDKQEMMTNQLHHMIAYGLVLDRRISYDKDEFARTKNKTKE